MARKSAPQPLVLDDSTSISAAHSYPRSSPLGPISPKSPRSPFSKFGSSAKKQPSHSHSQSHSQSNAQSQIQTQTQPQSQPDQLPLQQPPESPSSRSALPSSQTAPSLSTQQLQTSDKPDRDRPSRGGFFSSYKAAKSSNRLQQNAESARLVQEESMSRDADPFGIAGVLSKEKPRSESSRDRSMKRKPVGGPKSSDPSLSTSETNEKPPTSSGSNSKKSKPKPFNILNRTRSMRDEPSPKESTPPNQIAEPEQSLSQPQSLPLRAGPPQNSDRSFREIMSSNVRQRSEDRKSAAARDPSQGRDQSREAGRHQPSFSTAGHGFLSNLRGTAVKGAGALSKGLFGKGSRSGSTNEREHPVDDEKYVLKVINLGLVEQTRKTRISKKLEDSRDKTEFWMPALPWRAIDYLNYKGSDVEGLYRVPGSTPEIKKWQRRFDEEHDIDLFEQQDLYDINIIGSMLKQWLRELPDELLPKAAQDRVSRAASGAESVPQALIDELSNLPPFNYYLLFAITCHLSLLLAHSEKNKMNFSNLCICFQPCMKMDLFCFRFLVCEWRDCWKGCKTEDKYIALEYASFEPQQPTSAEGSIAVESHDERNLSSSDSSKPSTGNAERSGQKFDHGMGGKPLMSQSNPSLSNAEKLAQKSEQGKGFTIMSHDEWPNQKTDQGSGGRLPLSLSGSSLSTIQSTTMTVKDQTPGRKEMRPLSPIKPLSPLNL